MAETVASDRRKIVTGLGLGAAAGLALAFSPLLYAALVTALLLIAVGELLRLVRRMGVDPLSLVGFATVAGCSALAYQGSDRLITWLPGIAAAAVVLTFTLRVVRLRTDESLAAVASTVACALYVGGLGAFLIVLRRIEHGFRVALVFGLMACLNDAVAYGADRLAGKHSVASRLSPRKTWEGLAAGSVATFIVALVAWRAGTPFTLGRSLVLAMLVAVMMPLGKFAASAFKRDAGVKDGTFGFRGHGGVLDVLDGLLFAAPVFYFAYRVMVR